MKNSVLNTKAIAEIAIFSAIAFIIDLLQGAIFSFVPFFANGGSIGFAMLPIIIIGLRRGTICGTICGLLVGCLQMLGGIYAIADTWYNVFLQVLLDYPLAYTLVGVVSGIFYHLLNSGKSKGYNLGIVSAACVASGLAKFLSHFLAGGIYWKSFEIFDMPVNEWTYSLIYNGLYCFPNIIICLILAIILYLRMPKFYYLNMEEA